MNLNIDRLRSQLILEEGLRLTAYDDANGLTVSAGGRCKGNLTIGVGRNLDGNPLSAQEIAVIGHDGRSKPITHDQAIMLLDHDIQKVCTTLSHSLPWWDGLYEVYARVMVDLCFNMGISRLLGFKNFLSHMHMGEYAYAADDLKNSLWYNQVGTRAKRLVAMVQTGKDWVS